MTYMQPAPPPSPVPEDEEGAEEEDRPGAGAAAGGGAPRLDRMYTSKPEFEVAKAEAKAGAYTEHVAMWPSDPKENSHFVPKRFRFLPNRDASDMVTSPNDCLAHLRTQLLSTNAPLAHLQTHLRTYLQVTY